MTQTTTTALLATFCVMLCAPASAEPPAFPPTLKRAVALRATWVGRSYALVAHPVAPGAALKVTLTCQGAAASFTPSVPGLEPEAAKLLEWFFCHHNPVEAMLAYAKSPLLTSQRQIGVRGDDFSLSYGTSPMVVITQRRARLMGLGVSLKTPAPSTWQLRADWPVAQEQQEPSRVVITRGGRALWRFERPLAAPL